MQEIIARFGAPLLEGKFSHFIIGQPRRQVVEAAQAGDIGNGLDVENQYRFHAGNTPVDR